MTFQIKDGIDVAGVTLVDGSRNVTANSVTAKTFTSNVATGTAPLVVTSTTLVTNLNADLLDGQSGSYYQDASNLNAGTVSPARLPQANASSNGAVLILDSVTNTAIAVYAAAPNSVKTAYDAAVGASSKADTAYTNAIATAANATNLTSGTVSPARLPQANSSSNGAVLILDSVTNTAIAIYAAAPNSVKTAYDAAIVANTNAAAASTKADTAYSNATSFATTIAGTAYSNAVSVAASDATTKAGTAYSNATSFATTIAGTAYSNATSFATTIAGTAYANAVSVAAADATSKAGTAYANAVSVAAADATSKAGTAYSNATSFATTIAGTAYSNAVSVAASDATTKAGTAYSNAIAYSANATNLTSGTVNSARLPVATNLVAGAVTILDSVVNTSITTYAAAPNSVKTAYDAAITANTNAAAASTKADTAYSNAIVIASNASNLTSGTVAAGRLPAFTGDATSTAGTANLTLTASGVTAGTYGNSSFIPQITVDAKGRVTNAVAISSPGVSSYAYTAANNTFAIGKTDGATLFATISSVNNFTVTQDLIVSGNLTISGTTTYVNSTQLNIGDNIIVLNADLPGASAPTEDSGFTVNRGSSANVAFLWNETNDTWTLGNTAVTGYVNASSTVSGTQIVSTIATGTAPLSVTSTTAVTNLNADMLDGNHASAFAVSGHTHSLTVGDGVTTRVTYGSNETLHLVAGTNVSLAYDDVNNKVTISANDASIAYSELTGRPMMWYNMTDGTTTAVPDAESDTFTFAQGGALTVVVDATNDKVTYSHADTSTASNLTASGRTYVTGLTFDTYGHVTAYTTGAETVVDTNTTYDLLGVTSAGSGIIRLASSTAVNDDVTFVGSGATSVSSNATHVIISSTDNNTDTLQSISDDTTTNATYYPSFVTATTGAQAGKVSSSKLTFNPSTGLLTATGLSGTTVTGSTLTSTVATGTAPLTVTSTTAVTNLNADMLDGNHASAFATASHNHTSLTGVTSIAFATDASDSASIATTISGAQTFFDFNLTDDNNQEQWRWRFTPSGAAVYDAMRLASVSNTAANLFVSGTVTGTQLVSSIATGTAPLAVTSTTAVTNLNADMLDGYHASSFLTSYTETDTLASVTGRGNTTTANIGAIGTNALNLATGGNTGTWIGGVGDITSGWYLGSAAIGFKADNTTYAAIGMGGGNGLLYFGRTTTATGTLGTYMEVNNARVVDFKNTPTVNSTAVSLVGHTHAYLTAESDTLATVTSRGATATASIQVPAGEGTGYGFWGGNDSYGMAMGNSVGAYQYGPVTDYSIKMYMTGGSGRGFVWGEKPNKPVAALNAISGNMQIAGSFSAASKSFLIPHPTKPGMQLRHGSLEGPEHGVYIRGKLKGGNVIELPDYWTKLVDPDSITVQLTPIGKHQKLYVQDIRDNKVFVANDGLFAGEINCFFVVNAERVDVDKLVAEQ